MLCLLKTALAVETVAFRIATELGIDDINKKAEGWEAGLPLPFGRKARLHECDVALVGDCAEFHFIFRAGH